MNRASLDVERPRIRRGRSFRSSKTGNPRRGRELSASGARFFLPEADRVAPPVRRRRRTGLLELRSDFQSTTTRTAPIAARRTSTQETVARARGVHEVGLRDDLREPHAAPRLRAASPRRRLSAEAVSDSRFSACRRRCRRTRFPNPGLRNVRTRSESRRTVPPASPCGRDRESAHLRATC